MYLCLSHPCIDDSCMGELAQQLFIVFNNFMLYLCICIYIFIYIYVISCIVLCKSFVIICICIYVYLILVLMIHVWKNWHSNYSLFPVSLYIVCIYVTLCIILYNSFLQIKCLYMYL
jgi:NhaP-type Na+/H+ or K+/H+ antiporter